MSDSTDAERTSSSRLPPIDDEEVDLPSASAVEQESESPDASAAESAEDAVEQGSDQENGDEQHEESEEDDDDEQNDDDAESRKEKKRKRKELKRKRKEERRAAKAAAASAKFLEQEAEVSDDAEVSNDESEEDVNDLIDDEAAAAENEEAEVDSRRQRKKKKKNKRGLELMEDDYDLLKDAGIEVERVFDIDDDVERDDNENVPKRQRLKKTGRDNRDEDLKPQVDVRSFIKSKESSEFLDDEEEEELHPDDDPDAFIVDNHGRSVKNRYDDESAPKLFALFGDMSGLLDSGAASAAASSSSSTLTKSQLAAEAKRAAKRTERLLAKQQRREQRRAERLAKKKEAQAAGGDVAGDGFDDEDEEDEDDFLDDDEEDEDDLGYDEEEDADEDEEEAEMNDEKVAQLVDPAYLARHYLSKADKVVITTDIPERLQLRSSLREAAFSSITTDEDLRVEALHIYNHAFIDHAANIRPDSMREAIFRVLRYLVRDQRDIPFIETYCSDYWQPELTREGLWTIDALDEKWVHLQRRKQSLNQIYEQLLASDFDLRFEIESTADESFLDDVTEYLRYQQDVKDSNSASSSSSKSRFASVSEHNQASEESQPQSTKPRAAARIKRTQLTDLRVIKLAKLIGTNGRELTRLFCDKSFNSIADEPLYSPLDQAQIILMELASELEEQGFGNAEKAPRLQFQNANDLLNTARRYAVRQLTLDPMLRLRIRQRFEDDALVNTIPTRRGMQEIDFMHEYYPIKRLANKPVNSFGKASVPKSVDADADTRMKLAGQFALAEKAEDDGFINIVIGVPEHTFRICGFETRDPIMRDLMKAYLNSDSNMDSSASATSSLAEQWNFQRKQVLDEAFTLWKQSCIESVRHKLGVQARECISESAARKLESLINVAPYRLPGTNGQSPRVAACVLGDQQTATVFAMVNEHGELIDCLTLQFIQLRAAHVRADANTQARESAQMLEQRRSRDMELLRMFLSTHMPHVILLAATSEECNQFVKEIQQAANLVSCDAMVALADPQVGRVFMNSEKAKFEFPDRAPTVRQAISMARQFQDPLAEIASLWTEQTNPDGTRRTDISGNDILSLQLHPWQNLDSDEHRTAALRRVLISTACSVGVDLNEAAVRPHRAGPLSFVCGLGPRKADDLLRRLRQDGALLINLRQLIRQQLLQPVVYNNAAGFLKLAPREDADDEDYGYVDEDEESSSSSSRRRKSSSSDSNSSSSKTEHRMFFDTTRIHPIHFGLAIRIVVDSLNYEEYSEIENFDVEDSKLMRNVEKLIAQLRQPNKISELDSLVLQDFAKMLEESGVGRTLNVLTNIVSELKAPFHDPRRPWTPISSRQKFSLLTGETESSLREGLLVTCTITRITPALIIVRLASGLRGVIPARSMPRQAPFDRDLPPPVQRDRTLEFFAQHFPVGSTLPCRVTQIKYDDFEVVLDATSEVVKDQGRERRNDVDMHFQPNSEEERNLRKAEQNELRVEASKYRFLPRTIQHPMFRNCASSEAITELNRADKPIGSWLVRPSTRSIDHLTLSWKIVEDVVLHVDIQELNKPTAESLGRALVINKLRFEDLDHMMAEYVTPMNRLIQLWSNHEKFVHGNSIEVTEVLSEQKHKVPTRTPYGLWFDREPVGTLKLMISYLPRDTLHGEEVQLLPSGFQYHGQTLSSPAHVIASWKSFISGKQQSAAAPAPSMRDPRASRFAPLPPVPAPAPIQLPYQQPPHAPHPPHMPPFHGGPLPPPPPHGYPPMHAPPAPLPPQPFPYGAVAGGRGDYPPAPAHPHYQPPRHDSRDRYDNCMQ